ncbi:hypothetical protein ACQEU8_19695 [Streptomyces sp. CA-250714]|uniref:hypothetical protein n=1 Tax=Streptomyces sp. CA-250714 TaxID=3240060 RepID=UPI003D902782
MKGNSAGAAPGSEAHRGERLDGQVYDTAWAAGARYAVMCAASLLGLLLSVDAISETLTPWRAGIWSALASLLFVVLMPARLSAGPGWLSSRGLLRERRVRTDRLVAAYWSTGVCERLVLRDADGVRVEIDPKVLTANPPLWRLLDADVRYCAERGTLRNGTTALRKMARAIDRETAHTVFKVSGLH